MSKLARSITRVVLRELGDRKGFDNWWAGLDPSIRREISSSLAADVQLVLDAQPTETP